MFKVTLEAAKQIRQAAEEGNMQGMSLRVAVRTDDSGAFEYGMGFDEVADDDALITSEGIQIVIAPAFVEQLKDTTMDYVELEPGKMHFIFMNPNDPNYTPPQAQN